MKTLNLFFNPFDYFDINLGPGLRIVPKLKKPRFDNGSNIKIKIQHII